MKKRLKSLVQADLFSVIAPIVVLSLALSLSTKGFLSQYNIYSNFQQVAIYTVVGLAQMMVLSLGQMNLAVGSVGCLSTMIFGMTMQNLGMPAVVCMLLTCVTGVILGGIQGLLVTKTRINPFIISLSLLSIYKGFALVITKGVPYSELQEGFKALGSLKILSLPASFYAALVLCILVFILIRYRKLGKKLLACGANRTAAIYSGINYTKVVITGHCLSGLLCSLAAILQISRFGSAQMSIGDDWMMTSFVVPVLGGTLLSGGKVNVFGVMFGAVLMTIIQNSIVLWKFSPHASQLVLGLILLLAYEVDRMRRNMMKRQSTTAALKKEAEK